MGWQHLIFAVKFGFKENYFILATNQDHSSLLFVINHDVPQNVRQDAVQFIQTNSKGTFTKMPDLEAPFIPINYCNSIWQRALAFSSTQALNYGPIDYTVSTWPNDTMHTS